MFSRTIDAYIDSYRGLSKEIWLLSLITFINRAGTMVIPFLSLYLTSSLDFSLAQVGWIMTSFGVGSILGAWLGGKLTDKIGYYPVMLWSLITAGIAFILIQLISTFLVFCLGVFFLTLFADMFRPAMYVSVSAYSKEENYTRSTTLIRLAINLGFSMGPAIGGFIIASSGYSWLFWADGATCLAAAALFFMLFSPKDGKKSKAKHVDNASIRSPYSDIPYMIFLVVIFLTAVIFLQLFGTVPLYYKTIHGLSESMIGWLIASNGMVIFALEMPLINYLEKRKHSKVKIIWFGTLLFGLGFWIFNLSTWGGILIISMLLLTVGEMLVFPFANSFAMERSKGGNPGQYMALFPIAFSAAHIMGPNMGMQLIENFGYTFTWNIMMAIALLALGLCYLLFLSLKKDEHSH